ncbi:MAG TPA: immunoglobulin domain-containing protein [Verrucomicrobiae bacterium]
MWLTKLRWLATSFALMLILPLSVHPAWGANQTSEAVAFANWVQRYTAQTNQLIRGNLVAEGVTAARQRRAWLKTLMASDPRSALEQSRSQTNRAALPAEIQRELETPFSTNGDFIVQGALATQGGPKVEPMRRFVRLGGKTYQAHVFGGRLGGVSQYDAPLSGFTLDNAAVLAEATAPAQTPQPKALSAWTSGGKNVLIIRVDFSDLQGAPENYSAATVQNIADTQVAPFYVKSSYGLTSLTNTVSSFVYRMPQTASYYAVNNANDQLHTDAETAASANYTLANYDRIIVFFSSLGGLSGSQITYGGLADVGGDRVWCNGEFDFRVIAHELGHTYGLYHGNLWQVSDGNPISPSGVDTEYGDVFDTMGANYANSLATDFCPWFKNILGWVADSQIKTVTTNGTYRIYAFDQNNYAAAPGESVALKVVKDSTYNYWISCHTDFTTNYSMTNGVYVQWGYNYTRQSDLLDMNTPGVNAQDAGLYVGGIFTDIAAAGGQGVTIHPVARGGTPPNEYRDIQITFGSAPPIAPTFTASPASQSGVLGQNVNFTAVASGNPLPAYRWQRQAAGTGNWSTLSDSSVFSGSGTSNLTVNLAALSFSGDLYRCVASNSQGSVTSTPPASLTVNSALVISTLAGQVNNPGWANGTGTNATFYYPWGIACDPAGNIYVAQYYNGQIRKITPTGTVTTFASGFYGPEGIAFDAATNLYVCDSGYNVIKRVTPAGTVSILAGSTGNAGWADGTNTDARFSAPWGIAVDAQTNVFVSDENSNVIRKLSRIGSTANWAVTTIAGQPGQSGANDGTNSQARFNQPAGLACVPSGQVYVADPGNYTVRKLAKDATGTNWVVSTVAGQAGNYGNQDGQGTNSLFSFPYGLASDAAGNIYVTDDGNDLIRIISTNGAVTTLAGSSGSADGFYTAAGVNSPYGIAVDAFGNIYVADTYNYTIRVGHYAQVTIPALTLTSTGNNRILNWLVPTNSYRLLSTPRLSPAQWSAVTNIPITIANHYIVTNTTGSNAMYYRLVYP